MEIVLNLQPVLAVNHVRDPVCNIVLSTHGACPQIYREVYHQFEVRIDRQDLQLVYEQFGVQIRLMYFSDDVE